MANSLKKRGQKIIRKFSKASIKAGTESKEHIKENFIARLSHVENIRLLILEWALLIIALIMLAITQAFWFGNSYAENVFTSGGTYTEATLGEVNSMNPLFATTNSEKVLSKLMFATLTTVDRSGHIGIGLAKSIRATENGKVWKIKLRDGLKWSDGEPITNEDVLFTAELIKNPVVGSIFSSNLSNVKVFENEDGEVVFDLPTAYADFDSALNFPLVPKHILKDTDPKTLIENSFSTAPVTSGAFNYNAKQQATTSDSETVIYLSSNSNYYRGKTMLNSFAVHAYATKEDIINAVNAGSVTATAELSGSESSAIGNRGFIQKNSSLNSGAFIFFNTKSINLKNVELREAIRKGIDLEKIREKAPETMALDYPLLESQIKLTNYPEIPERNFEEAKAKIAELAEDGAIHVDIATVNSGYLPNVTAEIEDELKTLGITTNVSVYEESQEFITNIISKRNYDILVYEVELGADPDLLPYYHSSQASGAGLNLSNYRSMLVDDLLLGARDTLDEEQRVKKYETFLEYWVTGVPAIALYQPNLTYYYNKNVRTFSNDVRLVTAIDRFSDITNWAVTKTTKNKTP
ncbi:hypothetical protein IJG26_01185 [Candidatus Saccharibacteria bacterium]|nr:hypothetical protein [Candidatus Saccharibacteria bacterium]